MSDAVLTRRVQAALGREPLSRLSATSRAELDEALAAAGGFEDLPGKWQAALLTAEGEGDGAGARAGSGCCGGHAH